MDFVEYDFRYKICTMQAAGGVTLVCSCHLRYTLTAAGTDVQSCLIRLFELDFSCVTSSSGRTCSAGRGLIAVLRWSIECSGMPQLLEFM